MKTRKSLLFLAAASLFAAASCSSNNEGGLAKGEIVATVATENPVVVARYLDKVDTLKAAQDGTYSVSLDLKKGDPEFVYIFEGEDRPLGSFVLKAGDRIRLTVGENGESTIEGSEESVRLHEAVLSNFRFLKDCAGAIEDIREYNKVFIAHHREATKFIVGDMCSFSNIYPLMESDALGTPVFSHAADTILLRAVCDSLQKTYPESRYVQALCETAALRANAIRIQKAIDGAEVISYPDIEMKDTKGNPVKLSEVKAKVKMLYFWTSADPQQRQFNLDKILPIYNQFKGRGFEVYAVCIDPDRVRWADTINGQGLKWINVNDGLGTDSPSLRAFNVGSLPRMFLIVNEEIVTKEINGEAALKAEISRNL